MCQAFMPLLSPTGRIVNLSSVGSSLKAYSPAIQQRFRNPNMTSQDLETLAVEFEASVERGTESKDGFGGSGRSYSFSKACVNAFTAILAREQAARDQNINCCCPGWVATDMGFLVGKAPKKPIDGARIPVHVAFDDIGGVSGQYWANDGIRSPDVGKVQEW